jgi:hypothetical protein
VVRGFSPPAHPWEAGHRGVDLAARPGLPVYAAGPGRVGYAGDLAGRGVVTIVHGDLRTTYLPVRPAVHTGQTVRAGDRIGVVSAAPGHCPDQACLHWGLLRGAVYLDPLSLLGLGPVRLLPWWPAAPGATGPAPPAPAYTGKPGSGTDGPVPHTRPPNAPATDAGWPDAPVPDAGWPDAPVPDAGWPDAPVAGPGPDGSAASAAGPPSSSVRNGTGAPRPPGGPWPVGDRERAEGAGQAGPARRQGRHRSPAARPAGDSTPAGAKIALLALGTLSTFIPAGHRVALLRRRLSRR